MNLERFFEIQSYSLVPFPNAIYLRKMKKLKQKNCFILSFLKMEEVLSPECITFLKNSVIVECFSRTGKNTKFDVPSSCFFSEDLRIGKSRLTK